MQKSLLIYGSLIYEAAKQLKAKKPEIVVKRGDELISKMRETASD